MYDRKRIAEARRAMRSRRIHSLLSAPHANPKILKNSKINVMTAPLHLAPARLSGYEVCPQRSKGCTAACLHTAGNPAHMPGKGRARIARTKFYFEDRENFLIILCAEIGALHDKAKAEGKQPAVRLNATSDIPWERVKCPGFACSIVDAFPGVAFYDYTKITKRALASVTDPKWPPNYRLTFSATEDNHEAVWEVIGTGCNVAMVFATRPKQPLPTEYVFGGRSAWDPIPVVYPVIDGDEHDFRPLDPKGVIVGLRAKGDARKDKTGFVRP